jgi:uncharacterized membrane protein
MASIRKGKKAARKEYRGIRINAKERRAVWRILAYRENLRKDRVFKLKTAMSAVTSVIAMIQFAAIASKPTLVNEDRQASIREKQMALVNAAISAAESIAKIMSDEFAY